MKHLLLSWPTSSCCVLTISITIVVTINVGYKSLLISPTLSEFPRYQAHYEVKSSQHIWDFIYIISERLDCCLATIHSLLSTGDFTLGHVTCFSQWNILKCGENKDWYSWAMVSSFCHHYEKSTLQASRRFQKPESFTDQPREAQLRPAEDFQWGQ